MGMRNRNGGLWVLDVVSQLLLLHKLKYKDMQRLRGLIILIFILCWEHTKNHGDS